VRPALLVKPDVAAAREDTQRRSGRLGTLSNPFLTQSEWGTRMAGRQAAAAAAAAAETVERERERSALAAIAGPPLSASSMYSAAFNAGSTSVRSKREEYMFMPNLSAPPGAAGSRSAAPLTAAGAAATAAAAPAPSSAAFPDWWADAPVPLYAGSPAHQSLAEHVSPACRALLASTVTLDAFTQAAAPASPDSTRAMRCTKVFFDGHGRPIGGSVSVGLLDRKRAAGAAWDQRLPSGAVRKAAQSAPAASTAAGAYAGSATGSSATSNAAFVSLQYPFGAGGNFAVLHKFARGAPRQMRTDLGLLAHDSYVLLTGPSAQAQGGLSGIELSAPPAAGSQQQQQRQKEAAEDFVFLCRAMAEAGIDSATQMSIWRVLAAILTLGNVRVEEYDGPAASPTSAAPATPTKANPYLYPAQRPASVAPANVPPPGSAMLSGGAEVLATRAAELLGVNRQAFVESLVKRSRGVVSPGGGKAASTGPTAVVWTYKKASEARAHIESLIAHTYDRLVQWVVARMNYHMRTLSGAAYEEALEAAAPGSGEPLSISLVDVPGLEGQLYPLAPSPNILPATEWPALLGANPGTGIGAASATVMNVFPGVDALARNYAAEKCHALFLSSVFRAEQMTYEIEGIEAPSVPFDENAATVQMLDNRRIGIFSVLDEASAFPRSSDASVMAKVHTLHKRNPIFLRPADFAENSLASGANSLSPSQASRLANVAPSSGSNSLGWDTSLIFGIRHTGGVVCYSANGFLLANKDKDQLDQDCVALLAVAQSELPRKLFSETSYATSDDTAPEITNPILAALKPSAMQAPGGPNSLFATNTIDQLTNQLDPLALAHPHFVRCLRPNVHLRSDYADPALLHTQLVYSAALHSVALRHAGFPYKTTYADFYGRFILLAQQGGDLVYPPPAHAPIKELCRGLLTQLLSHPAFAGVDARVVAQFGGSKIFLRRYLIDALEALREKRLAAMDVMATRIQAMYKGHFVRKSMRSVWEGLRRLQATWQTLHARAMWLHKRAAIVRVQSWMRARGARVAYLHKRRCALVLQRWIRKQRNQQAWSHLRDGVKRLHALCRGYVVRAHVMRMLTAAVSIQAAARGFLVRRRVANIQNTGASLFQAAWRGYRFRLDNEDVLQFLAWKRGMRTKHVAVARIQATWRTVNIRRRFLELRNACLAIQRMMHAKLTRARFLRARRCATVMQSVARGHLARELSRRMRTLQAVADEMWRLALVRERESLELAKMRHEEAAAALQFGLNPSAGLALLGGSGAAAPSGVNAASSTAAVATVASVGGMVPGQGVANLVNQREMVPGLGSPSVIVKGTRAPTIKGLPGTPLATAAAASSRAQAAIAASVFGQQQQQRAGMSASNANAGSADALPTVTAVLDVDAQTDNSMVYPAGWTKTYSSLDRELRSAGSRVAAVALGTTHTMVLSEAGHLYTWGFGDRGQTGHGKWTGDTAPRLVQALLTDRHLAAALQQPASVSAPVTGAGALSVSFSNAAAEPMTPGQDRDRARAAGSPNGTAGGNPNASLSLTMPGAPGKDLAPFGLTSPAARSAALPIRIRFIASGDEHCLAVSELGTVYAWGNNRRGQLGLGHFDPISVPTPVRLATPSPDGPSPAIGAASMDMHDSAGTLAVAKACEVATGANFSMVLSAAGVVYTWGAGPYLGNGVVASGPGGNNGDSATPRPVKALVKLRVRHIAAGPDFSAVVTAQGDVYTWGAGTDGQLGLGEDVFRRRRAGTGRGSRKLQLAAAVDVAAGMEGLDSEFEYVTGKFRHRYVPTFVEGLSAFGRHARVTSIACGGHHCVAVSSTGRVFTWGANSHGQLGIGVVGDVPEQTLRALEAPIPALPLLQTRSTKATAGARAGGENSFRLRDKEAPAFPAGVYQPRAYVATPVAVKALDERHAISVAAGRRSCTVLTDMHEVLAWGCTSAVRYHGLVKMLMQKAGIFRAAGVVPTGMASPAPAAQAVQAGLSASPAIPASPAPASRVPRSTSPSGASSSPNAHQTVFNIQVPLSAVGTPASVAAAVAAAAMASSTRSATGGNVAANTASTPAPMSTSTPNSFPPLPVAHAPEPHMLFSQAGTAALEIADESDGTGSELAEHIANSVVICPFPTEVPLSEVPGRSAKRIFSVHSASMSLSAVIFSQQPVTQEGLREIAVTKAMQALDSQRQAIGDGAYNTALASGLRGIDLSAEKRKTPNAAPNLLVAALAEVAATAAAVAAAEKEKEREAAAAAAAASAGARGASLRFRAPSNMSIASAGIGATGVETGFTRAAQQVAKTLRQPSVKNQRAMFRDQLLESLTSGIDADIAPGSRAENVARAALLPSTAAASSASTQRSAHAGLSDLSFGSARSPPPPPADVVAMKKKLASHSARIAALSLSYQSAPLVSFKATASSMARQSSSRQSMAMSAAALRRVAADLLADPRCATALLTMPPSRLARLTPDQLQVVAARLRDQASGRAAGFSDADDQVNATVKALLRPGSHGAAGNTDIVSRLSQEADVRTSLLALQAAAADRVVGKATAGRSRSLTRGPAAHSRSVSPAEGADGSASAAGPALGALVRHPSAGLLSTLPAASCKTSLVLRPSNAELETAAVVASKNRFVLDPGSWFDGERLRMREARLLERGVPDVAPYSQPVFMTAAASPTRVSPRRRPVRSPAALVSAAGTASGRILSLGCISDPTGELAATLDELEVDTSEIVYQAKLRAATEAVVAESNAKARNLLKNIRHTIEAAVARSGSPTRSGQSFADSNDGMGDVFARTGGSANGITVENAVATVLNPMREYVAAVLREVEDVGKPTDANATVSTLLYEHGVDPTRHLVPTPGARGFPLTDDSYLSRGVSVRDMFAGALHKQGAAEPAPVSETSPLAAFAATIGLSPAPSTRSSVLVSLLEEKENAERIRTAPTQASVVGSTSDAVKTATKSTRPIDDAVSDDIGVRVADLQRQLDAVKARNTKVAEITSGTMGRAAATLQARSPPPPARSSSAVSPTRAASSPSRTSHPFYSLPEVNPFLPESLANVLSGQTLFDEERRLEEEREQELAEGFAAKYGSAASSPRSAPGSTMGGATETFASASDGSSSVSSSPRVIAAGSSWVIRAPESPAFTRGAPQPTQDEEDDAARMRSFQTILNSGSISHATASLTRTE
jgi:alpha-tubulin suppressor-like RCC1 family protein